jgi:hypothetical protein
LKGISIFVSPHILAGRQDAAATVIVSASAS